MYVQSLEERGTSSYRMADAATRCRGTNYKLVVVLIAGLSLGLVVGLVLYFTITGDHDEPTARTAAVGNCIPETGASVDRDTCILRG